MSVIRQLLILIENEKILTEAAVINTNYFNQYDMESTKKTKIRNTAKELSLSLFNAVPNFPDQNKQQIVNFLTFIGFTKGETVMEEYEKLLHDSLSQIQPSEFIKEFINGSNIKTSIKTVEIDLNEFRSTLEKLVKKSNEGKSREQDWALIRKSFIELPNQDKLIIKNFNGSKNTKVFELNPEFKWHVASVLNDEDLSKLKSSELWNGLDQSNRNALEKSVEKDGMSLRGACPYLGFARGVTKHCGNVPSFREGDIILVLWDNREKAHATVVISDDGKVRESKGPGNQKPSQDVAMHMLWLITHNWVEGIDDEGAYSPQLNFHISDVQDNDIVNHFMNFSIKDVKTKYDQYYLDRIDDFKAGKITSQDVFDEFIDNNDITLTMVAGLIGKENFEKVFINNTDNLKKLLTDSSQPIEKLQQVNNRYIENSIVQNVSVNENVKSIADWFDIKSKIDESGTSFKIFIPKENVISYIYKTYPFIEKDFEIVDVKMD